jgi:hypothetical protein
LAGELISSVLALQTALAFAWERATNRRLRVSLIFAFVAEMLPDDRPVARRIASAIAPIT